MKKLLLALLVPFAMLFSFPSFALTSGADSIDYAAGDYVIETETELIHRSDANLVTDNCMLRYSKCAADAFDDEDAEDLPLAASVDDRLYHKERIPIASG